MCRHINKVPMESQRNGTPWNWSKYLGRLLVRGKPLWAGTLRSGHRTAGQIDRIWSRWCSNSQGAEGQVQPNVGARSWSELLCPEASHWPGERHAKCGVKPYVLVACSLECEIGTSLHQRYAIICSVGCMAWALIRK